MALHVMICLHTSNSEDSLSCEFVFWEHNTADSEAFSSTVRTSHSQQTCLNRLQVVY